MLAATGIHGVVANAVARRRREIGIRVAIGASPTSVLRLVFSRTATLVGIGAAIGLLLALAVGQVLASVVYLVSPRDPIVLGGVAAMVMLIGILACLGPARRALGIEPMIALRSE